MMSSQLNQSGYKIFQELKKKERSSEDYISVESSPSSRFHKIGVSVEGFPIFFVKCSDENKAIDLNLELISVMFSKECIIKEGEILDKNRYTIVFLKTLNLDLQRYFTDVFSIILKNINQIPSEKELNSEVRKVIDLFSVVSKPPLKTVQGLWAELLVIEKSSNPEYLIESWHATATDKFDFNDSIDKLEIKSTNNSNRLHRFSIDQLNNNPGSKLLVVSMIIIEAGFGKSVFDLKDSIANKISNLDLEIKLNELIFNTLRSGYENANSLFFDYQFACDSLKGYDINDIPKIYNQSIPQGVLNVKFDVDFKDVIDVVSNGYDLGGSLLFSCLSL